MFIARGGLFKRRLKSLKSKAKKSSVPANLFIMCGGHGLSGGRYKGVRLHIYQRKVVSSFTINFPVIETRFFLHFWVRLSKNINVYAVILYIMMK